MLLPISVAHGATWQWTPLAGRERLTIQLSPSEQELSLKRTGTHSVSLALTAPADSLTLQGAGPGATGLVSNAQVRGREIELSLHNPAFGYVVTRPAPGQLVIDVFPDPLGARWTASGHLGPVSLAAAASVPAVSPVRAPIPANHPQAPVASPSAAQPTVPSSALPSSASPKPSVAPTVRAEQSRGLALTPPTAQAATAQVPVAQVPVPHASTLPQDLDDGPNPAVEDNTLPEMPASGALRAQYQPEAAPQVSATARSAPPPTAGESAGKLLTDMVNGVLSLKAYAASAPLDGGRARVINPQNIRASVNSDGPEAWGTEDSLSTSLPVAAGVAVPAPMTTDAPKGETPSAPSITQGAVKGELRQSIAPAGDRAKTPQGAVPAKSPISTELPVASPTTSGSSASNSSGTGATASTPVQTLGQDPTQAQPQTTAPTVPSQSAAQSQPQGQAQPMPNSTAVPTPPTVTPTKGADSQPQLMNETRQAATGPKNANATAVQGNATRPVVYVNEKGEVVPKPLEPDKMLAEAEGLMDKSQYIDALPILQELKGLALPPVQHEKVLYHIMDATNLLHAGKPLEGYEPIVAAASEAMNANMRSSRVPDALFRLGMANLDVGNLSEAEGYFKAFKRRHPYDMNVPLAFKNLGMAQLKAGKSAQAVKNLQMIVEEYPETSILREASVGLARALYAEDDLDKMAIITDFIDKRWPRNYVQEPDYLLLLADSEVRLNRLESALQHYWLYYNLVPTKPNNDKIFASIGDLYLRTGRLAAAKELFTEVRVRYPNSDGAAIALLRLAEQGIHDTPITIDEMFRVFVMAGEPKPPVAYRELQRDYPKDKRAILSGLKLAMWQLWNKEYTDAMGAAADFIDNYPEHTDVEQARQVIMRAFAEELKNALAEENFGRILILWNGFPLVRERYGDLDANMRHALARGYLERGDDETALEMLSEFLKSPKNPLYSDYAFTLFFNKYLQDANWNALLDLGELVSEWPMKPEMRSQLDYALALSSENLGLAAKALPLWQQLAARTDIPLYEQAYATYFLAKDAERRRDIKEAYKQNVAALNLFERLQDERSDRADPDRIKEAMGSLMDITEVGNHIPEALEWVDRYNQFVPDDSPEYPGLRFREARLYRKLGDNSKSMALLEQIVKKAPDTAFGKAAAMELRTFEVSRDLRNFIQEGK